MNKVTWQCINSTSDLYYVVMVVINKKKKREHVIKQKFTLKEKTLLEKN